MPEQLPSVAIRSILPSAAKQRLMKANSIRLNGGDLTIMNKAEEDFAIQQLTQDPLTWVVAIMTYLDSKSAPRPSECMRPIKIFREGDQWCMLFGENLMEGVAGFGSTPEEAAKDFDQEWMGRRA